jgi:hypothetical protein
MPEEVRHIQVNGKYRVKFLRAAGVKTGDGFEVEANGDGLVDCMKDAQTLYADAISSTAQTRPEPAKD